MDFGEAWGSSGEKIALQDVLQTGFFIARESERLAFDGQNDNPVLVLGHDDDCVEM
jgi:hypothetical protein